MNLIDYTPTINLTEIANSQNQCQFFSSEVPKHSLQLITCPLPDSDSTIICDKSTGPVVPPIYRHTIFQCFHSLAHSGIRATLKLISDRFVWPHMKHDIKQWTQSCMQCQHSKVIRHSVAPLTTFPVLDSRFYNIHVDIVGPLPPFSGYKYLVTLH